jgi:hypothetical protein
MNLSGFLRRWLATQTWASITRPRVPDQGCPSLYQELFQKRSKSKRELVSFLNAFSASVFWWLFSFSVLWLVFLKFSNWRIQGKEDMVRYGKAVGMGTPWPSRSSAPVTKFHLTAKLISTRPFCSDTKTFWATLALIVPQKTDAHNSG